jgi:hypothetical protein
MMATTYTQYQKGQKVNDASTCSNLFLLLIPLVNLGFAFSRRRQYVVPFALDPSPGLRALKATFLQDYRGLQDR